MKSWAWAFGVGFVIWTGYGKVNIQILVIRTKGVKSKTARAVHVIFQKYNSRIIFAILE